LVDKVELTPFALTLVFFFCPTHLFSPLLPIETLALFNVSQGRGISGFALFVEFDQGCVGGTVFSDFGLGGCYVNVVYQVKS
jgi:hypothetical protein